MATRNIEPQHTNTIFMLPLTSLTPSQLYISADKLKAVESWFHGDISKMEPIPVKELAGRLLMTDGHTRAMAALLQGIRSVPCIWDTDALDWAAYAADISMCAEEGITSVEALARRIVSAREYELLWHRRCDALYDEWYYKVLKQGDEVIFFTLRPIPADEYDIRPLAMGDDKDIEYFQLYHNHIPAARGCIEKYSYAFWEAADIKTYAEYRGQGFGSAMTAYLTNKILSSGKTATCRTLPKNGPMNRILEKAGYQRLYENC